MGAARSRSLFPNAADRGTHVNVSGMAMAKNAPNKDNALKLMEFLSAGEAQKIYAEQVYEYPVMPGAEPSEIVKSFGTIKADTLPLVGHRRQPQEGAPSWSTRSATTTARRCSRTNRPPSVGLDPQSINPPFGERSEDPRLKAEDLLIECRASTKPGAGDLTLLPFFPDKKGLQRGPFPQRLTSSSA